MVETARPTTKNFWRGVTDAPAVYEDGQTEQKDLISSREIEGKVTPVSGTPTKRYYRVDEVAEYFSISERTIYRLIDNGDLKAIRLRECLRIPAEELQELEGKSFVEF